MPKAGDALNLVSLSLVLILINSPAMLAQSKPGTSATCNPVTFTTDEDQKNMMQQLGINKMREGPSGDEHAPNHAN